MPNFKTASKMATAEANLSRHDLLDWVNNTVNGQYKKIEELCSGVAYCQMVDLLFPQSVPFRRIKINAKLEHEFLQNLKLFQDTLSRLNIDKTVPIERLIKGRFQDNFEFLQWFKKFFDTYAAGNENLKARVVPAATISNISKSVTRRPRPPPATNNGRHTNKTEEQKNTGLTEERSETRQQLMTALGTVERERDEYYEKLTHVEALIKDEINNNEYCPRWCKRALDILYTPFQEDNNRNSKAGNADKPK